MERAALHPTAAFQALCEDDGTAALADGTAARVLEGGVVEGVLTSAAIDVLSADLPETLTVDGGPALMIVTTDGWLGLGVCVDRSKTPALAEEIAEEWWQAADRRASSDGGLPELRRRRAAELELRAHVLVTWKRSSRLVIAALVALSTAVAWPPLGDGVGDFALRCVGALVIMWPLDTLIERWYHRRSSAS